MYPDHRHECDEVKRLFWKFLVAPRLPFPDTGEQLDAPNEKGVYLIEDSEGRVLHVGRTPQKKNGIRQQLQLSVNRSTELRARVARYRFPSRTVNSPAKLALPKAALIAKAAIALGKMRRVSLVIANAL